MRTQFTILLFLLGPLFAQSQTPVPFPTQDASWLYISYDDFGNQVGSHFFYLDGDSSYLGETWSVLHGSTECLIRQDSSLKVWIVPNGLTTPEFLYDFGAAVGDTIRGIRTQFLTTLDTVVVTSISSWNGVRTWYLSSVGAYPSGADYSWTEGIGDESWLPASSPINLVSGTTYLNCFTNMAYNAPNNPCIVANDEALSRHLQVYPNPSTGKLRLDFDQPMELGGMRVIDCHGKLVRSYDAFRGALDLDGLEIGIYFLLVEAGEGKMLTRKLVLR